MSRRELLATHNAEEIAEWQAFDLLEPFGPDSTDVRFARLTQILFNAFRGDAKPLTTEDCTLGYKPEPTEEDLLAKAMRVFGVDKPRDDSVRTGEKF